MGKHEKPTPGQQQRINNNETWREADGKWQPPTAEQIAKDVAQIDSQTYTPAEEPDIPYYGRTES